MNLILVLAALAAICAPGVLFWSRAHPEEDRLANVTWGATLGLALAILLAFYLAQIRLSWFWPVWTVALASSLVARWRQARQSRPVLNPPLLLVLALVATTRVAPALLHEIPPGWDPSFHLILAKKLVLLDHTFDDWAPFANVELNYPLGSHLLIAVVTRLTGVPLHRVFQFLIPALGVLSTAQIYLFARRIFGSESIALYSAIAYGLWAYLGSIAYYAWGGLPNELGMTFLIAALALFTKSAWNHLDWVAAGVFLAALTLSHHHVMLVAVALVPLALLYRHRGGQEWKRPIAGMGLAIVLAAPWLIGLAQRAASLGQTGVLRFDEPHTIVSMAAEVGVVFLVFAIAGIWCSWRKVAGKADLLLASVAILLFAFVVCGPIYRLYSLHRFGQEYSVFTPSRFVTDAVYFLSIFAGYAIHRFTDRWNNRRGYVIAAALLLGCLNAPLWAEVYRADAEETGRWLAYQWIEKNTDPKSVVIARDPWASYVSWRRTPLPPLPVSEPRPAIGEESRSLRGEAVPLYEVVAPRGKASGPIVWRDSSGWAVARVQRR